MGKEFVPSSIRTLVQTSVNLVHPPVICENAGPFEAAKKLCARAWPPERTASRTGGNGIKKRPRQRCNSAVARDQAGVIRSFV